MDVPEPVIKKMLKLGQGNPGAITVCASGYGVAGERFIDNLEKVGKTGSDLWAWFKGECMGDLATCVGRAEFLASQPVEASAG